MSWVLRDDHDTHDPCRSWWGMLRNFLSSEDLEWDTKQNTDNGVINFNIDLQFFNVNDLLLFNNIHKQTSEI